MYWVFNVLDSIANVYVHYLMNVHRNFTRSVLFTDEDTESEGWLAGGCTVGNDRVKIWKMGLTLKFCLFRVFRGFPGGAVDKKLPANAGDTGLIPGLGGFHRLQSNYAHVPQLPRCPRARAPQQEKPPQWEAHAPQLERSPRSLPPEKLTAAAKTQHNQKKVFSNLNIYY